MREDVGGMSDTTMEFRMWWSPSEGVFCEGDEARIHRILTPQGLPGFTSRENGIAEDCLPADARLLDPIGPAAPTPTHWGPEEGGGESAHDGADPADCYLCRTAVLASTIRQLESRLRVAEVGVKFGKAAVAERDAARAAHEATQAALVEMERKRDAWKEAAGVEYRNLDVSPAEQALLVRQWQAATQHQVHKAARLAEQRDAVLELIADPSRWLAAADELAEAIRAVFEGELTTPADESWCPRCVKESTADRYTQESSTLWRCRTCDAVLVVPDPPIEPVPA
jgi:hypothetical protein